MPLPFLALATPPDEEPVTLADAKIHLRVDGTAEDTLIGGLIVAARQAAEAHTNRAFVAQTWLWTLDDFPCAGKWLELPKAPLASLEKIEVRGASGTYAEATLADFDVLAPAGPYAPPATVGPMPDKAWPSSDWAGAARARFQFVAGYGDGESVPEAIKSAIKLILTDLYENRAAQAERALTENAAVKALLFPFRVHYV